MEQFIEELITCHKCNVHYEIEKKPHILKPYIYVSLICPKCGNKTSVRLQKQEIEKLNAFVVHNKSYETVKETQTKKQQINKEVRKEILEYNILAAKWNFPKKHIATPEQEWINYLMDMLNMLLLEQMNEKDLEDKEKQVYEWVNNKLRTKNVYPLTNVLGRQFDSFIMSPSGNSKPEGIVSEIVAWGFRSNNPKWNRKFYVNTSKKNAKYIRKTHSKKGGCLSGIMSIAFFIMIIAYFVSSNCF